MTSIKSNKNEDITLQESSKKDVNGEIMTTTKHNNKDNKISYTFSCMSKSSKCICNKVSIILLIIFFVVFIALLLVVDDNVTNDAK